MTEVIADQTLPLLHGPTDKEKKYDRQLRLWAASGQAALENSHILLLNSGAGTVGVETLKNLVLPGIGKFTIADNATVTDADLGVNFFLDESCLGGSRSECCVKLLQELNPDVQGAWFPQHESEPLENLFRGVTYSLILLSFPIDPQTLSTAEDYSRRNKIPIVYVHSAGFYSYFRIYLADLFPIIDTHPDSTATTDLRLLSPWPELSEFAAELTSNMDEQNAHDHGHIPYVAILLHYLKKWEATHKGPPISYADKVTFRKSVAAGARTNNAEGGEENFDEAVAAVLKTITKPTLGSSVKEIFDHFADEVEPTLALKRMKTDSAYYIASRSSFWIIVDAVKEFYNRHNALPLPGSVPDMKAQSTVYVRLQNIYKAKARQDVNEVVDLVRKIPGGSGIDVSEVEIFCKNAAFIKLIHGTNTSPSSIQDIASREAEKDELNASALMPLSLFPIYLALSATSHASVASASEILATLRKDFPNIRMTESIEQAAEEVARSKGGELHNISALTGGMVAQEIIKIITKQYIPIDNTCIFDGIRSRTQVLKI